MKRKCLYGGKVSYKDIEQAKEARKTFIYKGRARGDFSKAKIYQCPNCFMYHLTTRGY